MLEVLAGAVVAMAAIVVVVEPLFLKADSAPQAGADADLDVIALEESDSPKIQALLALKEIEFDRATGKLSDEDYGTLKARYSAAAVAEIKREAEAERQSGSVAGSRGSDDAAEEAVKWARQRVVRDCAECGPRPEVNAVFCSQCGRSLVIPDTQARCWLCGATLPADAKFCAGCGRVVAA